MIAVIVNPVAGRGKAIAKFPDVRKILEHFSLKYEVFQTRGPYDATDIAQRIRDSGDFEKILIVGGDGTINEVIQSLVGSRIPILPVPLGTGNDFAKYLYPHKKFDSILYNYLLLDKAVDIDVGVVTLTGSERYFINGMGIGFDSEVLKNMEKMRILKGDFLYTASAILTFLSFGGADLRISINNGEQSFDGRLLLFNVGNGQYLGGSFRLFPKASLRDGLLDISMISPMGPKRFFTNFYKAFKGKHLHIPEVTYLKASQIAVSSQNPFCLQLDGELMKGLSEIEVHVLRKSLSVIL